MFSGLCLSQAARAQSIPSRVSAQPAWRICPSGKGQISCQGTQPNCRRVIAPHDQAGYV